MRRVDLSPLLLQYDLSETLEGGEWEQDQRMDQATVIDSRPFQVSLVFSFVLETRFPFSLKSLIISYV